MLAEWIEIAVTIVLGVVGLYLANSIRPQIQARVAEKRLDSYGALWTEEGGLAAPRGDMGGAVVARERHALYEKLADWYYRGGNGMLLSQQTRNIYLAAKENLICAVDKLRPASLREQVRASDEPDTVRGWRASDSSPCSELL